MTQYIEPFLIGHVWDSQAVLERLARLIDDGGCTGPLDDGIECYLLSPPPDDEIEWDSKGAREVLRGAIRDAWHLGNEE